MLNERTDTEHLVHRLVSSRHLVDVHSFCSVSLPPFSSLSAPSESFLQTRILVCRKDWFLAVIETRPTRVLSSGRSRFYKSAVNLKLGTFCCNCQTQLTTLETNLSTCHALLIPRFSEQPALKCTYCPRICPWLFCFCVSFFFWVVSLIPIHSLRLPLLPVQVFICLQLWLFCVFAARAPV